MCKVNIDSIGLAIILMAHTIYIYTIYCIYRTKTDKAPHIPLIWWRSIDDIFIIWTDRETSYKSSSFLWLFPFKFLAKNSHFLGQWWDYQSPYRFSTTENQVHNFQSHCFETVYFQPTLARKSFSKSSSAWTSETPV